MNIVTFQFGQCGNQVGQSLYSYLYNDIFWEFQRFKGPQSLNTDYKNCSQDIWFTVNKKNQLSPRSVLIDTENKVTAIANKNIPYNFKNIVSGAYGGSANNWACGYNCKSNLLIGEILEATRKELEKCNFVKSFISLFGAGGGTGSGLGCYAIEKLREEYPMATGWSLEQKQQLLAALQKHGATDPFVIASEIPGRTVIDVQLMMKKYERLALQKMDVARSCKAPLDQWIETIQWTAKQPLNISCVSRALKYIALFEDHQPSLINLPDSYELLSDLSSGVSAKHVTNETAFFLRKCLYQLSVKIKNDNTDEEEEFLENFKAEKLEYKKTYGKRKATDPDPLMNPLLNNLVVPRKLLKKSTDVVLEPTEGITTNKQILVKSYKKNEKC